MNETYALLTEKQRAVFELIYNQKITYREAATRLQISHVAVAKHMRYIRKKIYRNVPPTTSHKKQGGTVVFGNRQNGYQNNPSSPVWRIHGLHFKVKTFYTTDKYRRIYHEIGNFGIRHKQFTIMLHRAFVRVQSAEGISWTHEDRDKAISAAESDVNAFLRYAGKKYGFYWFKDGKVSINLVSAELAQENSVIATKIHDKTQKNYIHVIGRDGRVWFVVDRSEGSWEHEYIGKHSIGNAERVEEYLNDILQNAPLTNSQLTARLGDMTTAFENAAVTIGNLVKVIQIIKERLGI